METIKKGSKGEAVKQLQAALNIKADGVFGVATEAAVKAYQAAHGLTADGIVGYKTWASLQASGPVTASGAVGNGVEYFPINTHITKSARKIKYLVIHYTAGASSAGDAERGARKVFLSRSASADYVVDDDSLLQVNPDCERYYCWAVGDNVAPGHKRLASNKDCISIEVCSNLKKGTTAAVPNHAGWYFSSAAVDQATKLARILMKRFGIDKSHVVRHYDVTGKLCPGIVGWNTGALYDEKTGKPNGKKNSEEEWIKFKEGL